MYKYLSILLFLFLPIISSAYTVANYTEVTMKECGMGEYGQTYGFYRSDLEALKTWEGGILRGWNKYDGTPPDPMDMTGGWTGGGSGTFGSSDWFATEEGLNAGYYSCEYGSDPKLGLSMALTEGETEGIQAIGLCISDNVDRENANCVYSLFMLEGTPEDYTVTPIHSADFTPTQFYTFTYSTTTQMARLTGYWNATTTPDIFEQLVFFQNSSILGKENLENIIATTTGQFDMSFFFSGLPYASSTVNSVFGLYAMIKQVDRTNLDLTNCDTFSGYDYALQQYTNCANGVERVLVATSTIINRFTYNLDEITPIDRLKNGYSFEYCTLGFEKTDSLPYFKISGFDLGLCLGDIVVAIFQPLPQDYSRYATQIKEDIFNRVPFAYIVRIENMIASTTLSEMPSIDYTFSTSTNSALAPILGGERIHFEPFDMATGTGITSIKSDGANGLPEQNIWEIAEPFYNLVLYLALIIMVIGDLLHVDLIDQGGTGVFGPRAHGRPVTNDAYRYKEKLYAMSKRK